MYKFEMLVNEEQLLDSAYHRNGTIIGRLINKNVVNSIVMVEGTIEINWTPEPDGVTYNYKSFAAMPREVREFIISTEDWRSDPRVEVVFDNQFILTDGVKEKILDIGRSIQDVRELFDIINNIK